MDFLGTLNTEQRKAVEQISGPLLVLAGAGTGKTKVLTARITNIIMQRAANPYEILAVTFTNKAANEMRERVLNLIGPSGQGVNLGTFHSLGVRILRKHGEIVDIKNNFVIINDKDQIRLIKEIMQSEDIDITKFIPKIMAGIINRWKDRGLVPGKPTSEIKGVNYANGKAPKIYEIYQEKLRIINAVDFGDLLLQPLVIFAKHDDILSYYQEKFKYILVDEYQDTNISQYYLLRLLSQKHKNICCVGDDDQSIYSWRGAEVENILKFEKDYENAEVIRLQTNYRSTKYILEAATNLINNNSKRHIKNLIPNKDEDAEKITVYEVMDSESEASKIAEEIENLKSKEYAYNDIAILVRAGFQTRAFEEKFISLGIPYKIIGGQKFYERAEIRDIIAYIRLILQKTDDLAFERIVNQPKRGIGKTTVNEIKQYAFSNKIPLFNAVKNMITNGLLKTAAEKSLKEFIYIIENLERKINLLSPTELIDMILKDTGYMKMLEGSKDISDKDRVENLKELKNVVKNQFDSLKDFIEYISLIMDSDDRTEEDEVKIMTLHAAKGLEFDTVFLPGWEEGIFPSQRTLEDEGKNGEEEERRLAYVGLTRAKRKIYILYAVTRMVFGNWQTNMPSRFLKELPEGCIDCEKLSNTMPINSFNYKKFNKPKKQIKSNYEDFDFDQTPESEKFAPGRKVRHETFGEGRIISKDGNKLQIAFEGNGIKKLMLEYIELI